MQTFKIAVMGDSLIERWGVGCASLGEALRLQYSRSEFHIENYGLHGARAGNVLWRIGQNYQRGERMQHCLSDFDPQITIVESLAYTHRGDGPEGMSEYRDLLRRIFDEIHHTTGSQIIFCLTLPPHRDRFAESDALFLHTSRATRQRFADEVKLYLDEARRIAQDEEWMIADVSAEVEKRVAAGENMRRFIDQNDQIHPSPYGYEIQARVIVRAIDTHRLIDEKIER